MAAMLGVVAVAGGTRIPVPSLFREGLAGAPLAVAVPLLAAALLVRGLGAGPADLEAVAGRPARLYGAALVLAAGAVAVGAGALLTIGGIQPLGLAAGRNFLGYAGLALAGGRLLGRHGATALPTAYLLFVVMTGAPPDRVPPWVWPLAGSGDKTALAIAVSAMAAGLVLLMIPGRDPRRRL